MTPDLQAIVAVPIETQWEELPADVQNVLDQLFVRRRDMVRTHHDSGKRLVLAHLRSPGVDPATQIGGLFVQFSLDWDLLRLQDWDGSTVYRAEAIDAWLDNEYEYDSEGEKIPGSAHKRTPERWHIFSGAAQWQDS